LTSEGREIESSAYGGRTASVTPSISLACADAAARRLFSDFDTTRRLRSGGDNRRSPDLLARPKSVATLRNCCRFSVDYRFRVTANARIIAAHSERSVNLSDLYPDRCKHLPDFCADISTPLRFPQRAQQVAVCRSNACPFVAHRRSTNGPRLSHRKALLDGN